MRNAQEHLRIVITRVEWVRKHTASLDDFKADVGELDADVTAIKAKTDGLNFTGDDVKATLDGETAVTDTSSLEAKLDDMDPVIITKPRYLSSYYRNGAGVTGEPADAIYERTGTVGLKTAGQGGSQAIWVFAIDDIDDYTKGVVKFTRSGMLNNTNGNPYAAETPCGNGEFQLFLARDINGFADEAAWLAFNNTHDPEVEENYGESTEPASIAGVRDIATTAQLTGFNRLIIRWYRSDAVPALVADTRIDISGLRVEAKMQRLDGSVIRHNVPIVKKFIANRRRADPVTKQLTIYEDDKMTAALVKRLKDAAGNPTDDPAEEDPV